MIFARRRKQVQPERPPSPESDDRRKQRGVALALTLVMITLMTALVVEANDRAHQKLLQAAGQRDAAKSFYLARSGANIYLLILTIDQQLQAALQATGLGDLIGGGGNLWQMVPFLDSGLLRMVMSGASDGMDEDEARASFGAGGGGIDLDALNKKQREKVEESHEVEGSMRRHDFLEFEGDFRAELIQDEGAINVNWLVTMGRPGQTLEMNPAARALIGIFSRNEYKEFFRDELEMEPWELVANIKDWADADTDMSGAFGGDENKFYEDDELPFRPKNAPFLTHRELQMVHGMSDRAYGMFGQALEVWGSKLNVNAASQDNLAAVLLAFMQPIFTPEQVQNAFVCIRNELHPLWLSGFHYAGRNGPQTLLSDFERCMQSTQAWTPGTTQLWFDQAARNTLGTQLLTG